MMDSVQGKKTLITMLFFSIYLFLGCSTVHALDKNNTPQLESIVDTDEMHNSESAVASDQHTHNKRIIVFYSQYCNHCKAWLNSTGLTYDEEAPARLGAQAPTMTLYDLSERKNFKIYQDMLSSGKLSKSVDAVPTFLVADQDSVEIKRFVGSMDKNAFYDFVKS